MFKNILKISQELFLKKGCKKSIFMILILYTTNIYNKRVKAMGFILINKRQKNQAARMLYILFWRAWIFIFPCCLSFGKKS